MLAVAPQEGIMQGPGAKLKAVLLAPSTVKNGARLDPQKSLSMRPVDKAIRL